MQPSQQIQLLREIVISGEQSEAVQLLQKSEAQGKRLDSQPRGQVKQALQSCVEHAGSGAPQLIFFQVCTISTFSDIPVRLGKEPWCHVLQGKAHTTHTVPPWSSAWKLMWWVTCSAA